jgi:cytochrome P450
MATHDEPAPPPGVPVVSVTRATVATFERYEDCVALLKDERFGKEIRKHLPPERLGDYPPPPEAFQVIDRNMLNLDPPDHTRLRALVQRAFTPRFVEGLRPHVQRVAEGLIDAAAPRGAMDVMGDFALPFSLAVIAEMLGIPLEGRGPFREWTQVLLFGGSEAQARAALRQFTDYMGGLIDARRASPREDLLSALVAAEDAGDRLNRQELLSMVFLLLSAGHETTITFIGDGMLTLLRHPAALRRLLEEPSLMKTALEELLRFRSPVETTSVRWAFVDAALGGKSLRTGQMALARLTAANRDPAQFADPDTLELTRTPNRHLSFGSGIHHCLGAALARLEGEVAFATLLRRLPELRLSPAFDERAWNDRRSSQATRLLPVTFSPRAPE